ncbi:platelet glycoprotein Ib beta chain isoform X2 [Triplophysa rosa]|uniref:Platelet glycoprotein Ib beta chain n=2 Tax=Triplophysa rosa TaxID=992332 RepID=A0A9W7TLX4_TRIRA|nr:platelet glycoprotein Ib beta chain isoform X2 [Triplophysa rosa]KAI7798369.1 platelet glycoprotein Ib beta chain precursor [Triplophysa rosa]
MRCNLLVLKVLLSVLSTEMMMTMVQGVCSRMCSCRGAVVNCGKRGLTAATLPSSFPPHTSELYLNDNHLTSLPNNLLDSLSSLRLAHLHGNPWSCDCGILYLRGWLLKQRNDALIRNVTCSSPAHLRGRLVVYLVEEEVLESCRYWMCDLALASQISLFIFIVVQALLLASVILFLRRFERLTREAQRTAAETFTAEDDAQSNEYVMLKDRSM